MNLFKKLLSKNRTLEEKLEITAFTFAFCLFVLMPVIIVLIITFGG